MPDALDAKLSLGRLRLARGDFSAEALLRDVPQRHPLRWSEAGGELLRHYRDLGDVAAAEHVVETIDAHAGSIEQTIRERWELRRGDRFEPHDLLPAIVDGVYKTAGHLPAVGRLWILRRPVRHFADFPAYVVAFTPAAEGWSDPNLLALTRTILAEEWYIPGTVLVAPPGWRHFELRRARRRLPGAEIFSRCD